MSTSATALADRLLDAQVAFLLAELTGPDGPRLVAEDAAALAAGLASTPLGDLVDREAARATVHELLAAVGGSPAIGTMVEDLVPLLHDLEAHDEHQLGDVVMWGGVEAVVDVLTRSEQLREEVLRRLAQSPAVSTLSMRFVSALVGDAVQQNRERAEKLPGMKSALAMGDFAARTARGMTPKQLENVVGGVADRGAQAAMERVTRAFVDAFDEAMVREAVMQVWDLHAEEAVAGLRGYLERDDVEAIAGNAHALWLDLHATPWFRAVVDAAVDAFLDRHADRPLGHVLADHGVDPDLLATLVERHAAGLVQALHASGALEAALRRRLAPFFTAPATLALLTEAD